MNEILGPSPEEMGNDPEEGEKEPSPGDVVEACKGVLDENTLEAIGESADIAEATGLAVTALYEVGKGDPFEFLEEKGLILPDQE